jgi:hypothetical protein
MWDTVSVLPFLVDAYKRLLMNLKLLNRNFYGMPEHWETQVTVLLIASELKSRKLINDLKAIGRNTFCMPDLSDLVLSLAGFNDRPNGLYTYYFNLLDQHCGKVTHPDDLPIEEAMSIYGKLRNECQRGFSRR